MPNNHDASYKQLFSHPEVVRDLVLGFIPDQMTYVGLLHQDLIRRAYILDSFKHSAETALLRQMYQDAFCQIGVVCTEDQHQ